MAPVSEIDAPQFLKLLAHDVRWQLLAALAESDRRVQELAEQLARPQNLVSYHLRLLRESHLIHEHRSQADSRDVYYSLDIGRLSDLYQESGLALHPALACQQEAPDISDAEPAARPYRVLFLCTHNSARSQMAEGILRALGGQKVEVFSAGSHPSAVHPLAIRATAAMGIDISTQQSKSMAVYGGQQFDAIITVCDQVRELCPAFPDDPRQVHWSFPDPSAVTGSPETRYLAFRKTASGLASRITYLLSTIPPIQQPAGKGENHG